MNKLLTRLLSFEQLTYALIFLFPIAGMLVRGWLTNIYNGLALLGLFYLSRRHQPLCKQERVYLLICTAYVAVYILSALVNGWGKMQTHELGTELRFWLVIPIYLLVREQPKSWRWLLYGSLIGIIFIFIQSYHEVFINGLSTSWGVYSKNIIGSFVVLMGFWVLFLWGKNKSIYLKLSIMIAFILAILAAALSGSRGAYVGFVVMFIAWLLLYFQARWISLLALLITMLVFVVYWVSPIVNNGVDNAVANFEKYMINHDKAHSKILDSSTAIHLEMWRAAKYFFPDHPILGVGPGNYQIAAKKYAQEGKVNPAIAKHGHPHNSFLEALYSKGVIGLISLLLLLYYPFYVMFKNRNQSRMSAGLGMLHIAGLSAFSMFDASPILFNNYTSILLLGIAVFFSHHLNQIRQAQAVIG